MATQATIRLPKWGRTIEARFGPCEIKTFRVPRDTATPVVETNLLEWVRSERYSNPIAFVNARPGRRTKMMRFVLRPVQFIGQIGALYVIYSEMLYAAKSNTGA